MKSVLDLINKSTFEFYVSRTNTILALRRAFVALMTAEWSENCEVADYQDGRLLLYVTHSGWATRLHYAAPEIMSVLRKHALFVNLDEIKCKILPKVSGGHVASVKRLSEGACQILKDAAANIGDSDLRDALLRLARPSTQPSTGLRERELEE